jgi:hypothetical protein
MMCEKVKGFHISMPECKVDDRPIAAGDSVQFRVDGDWAYMPAAKGTEEGLRILTTELKVFPPLPAVAGESGMGSNPSGKLGLVIGTGMHILEQKPVGWSTNPSSGNTSNFQAASADFPVMPTGSVTAVPVAGGAPAMVMPSGPVGGGGGMTGMPVTGGPQMAGVPAGPAPGASDGGAPSGPPAWVHLLRVRVGEKFYQLECSDKPCELNKKPIELGDTLMIRVEKKWAYVSSGTQSGGKEQKFRILGGKEDD